jgi:hypothetical protein
MTKTARKFKDSRLNAVMGKPEEVVRVNGKASRSILVKFGKKEQDVLEATFERYK